MLDSNYSEEINYRNDSLPPHIEEQTLTGVLNMKTIEAEMYEKCGACRGTGIDPASLKSYQEDEWDCLECDGYGDALIY